MQSIDEILRVGSEHGIEGLSPKERHVWLIAEAEVYCIKDGIESFLEKYPSSIEETALAFSRVGAKDIADSLRNIIIMTGEELDNELSRANNLISDCNGYSYESIQEYLEQANGC
jgi:hypothetical protein